MANSRRKLVVLAVAAGAALTLAACGGSPAPGPTGTGTSATVTSVATTPAATPSSAATSVAAKRVSVTLDEFSISLAPTSFTPGAYTFEIHNTGNVGHNLTIEGPGVDHVSSPLVNPGATGELTVTLRQGTYEVWCSIGLHKDSGMQAEIQVS